MNETTRVERAGRRLRWGILAALVVLVMGLAAACGDDDEGDASSAAAEATSAAASVASQAESAVESVAVAGRERGVRGRVPGRVRGLRGHRHGRGDRHRRRGHRHGGRGDRHGRVRRAARADGQRRLLAHAQGRQHVPARRLASRPRSTPASPINYVLSYGVVPIQGFSQQYAGRLQGQPGRGRADLPADQRQARSPRRSRRATCNEQISQIQALADTDQIDCLSIEPQNSDGLTQITNEPDVARASRCSPSA